MMRKVKIKRHKYSHLSDGNIFRSEPFGDVTLGSSVISRYTSPYEKKAAVTLKVQATTAAEDILKYVLLVFRENKA